MFNPCFRLIRRILRLVPYLELGSLFINLRFNITSPAQRFSMSGLNHLLNHILHPFPLPFVGPSSYFAIPSSYLPYLFNIIISIKILNQLLWKFLFNILLYQIPQFPSFYKPFLLSFYPTFHQHVNHNQTMMTSYIISKKSFRSPRQPS